MTSPNTKTGWNTTAGSNLTTTHSQRNQTADEYFRTNYDFLTGVRIAGTLGGFFALVILTLLYKSKCKKNSCVSTPVHPVNIPQVGTVPMYPALGRVNSVEEDDDQLSMSLTRVNSAYMNKVNETLFTSPAVLLTAANSESSEDDDNLSLLNYRAERGDLCRGGPQPCPHPHNHPPPLKSKTRLLTNINLNPTSSSNFLNPSTLSPPPSLRTPNSKMKWLQQNIDIHVILPTPTISPSGSENFCQRVHQQSCAVIAGKDGGVGGIPIPVPLPSSRRCSEKERSRASSFGADSNSNHSYSCSYNGNGSGTNPLFFLDNLKYVDDTSSENIPTRASDFEDQDQDTRSIGSDSVFAYFEHNFDHVAPLCSSEGVSVSGLTVASSSNGKRRVSLLSGSGTEDDDCECRVILTQAHAQVHHRESFCSELESLNDYLESRRRSSSTQTTVSDLRQCLSLSSGPSPPNFPQQHPANNNNAPPLNGGGVAGDRSHLAPPHPSSSLAVISNPHIIANAYSVNYKEKDKGRDRDATTTSSPSTSTNPSNPNNSMLLSVNLNPAVAYAKKRNFEALKKTFSLQCDEPLAIFSTARTQDPPNNPHPSPSEPSSPSNFETTAPTSITTIDQQQSTAVTKHCPNSLASQ